MVNLKIGPTYSKNNLENLKKSSYMKYINDPAFSVSNWDFTHCFYNPLEILN